MKSQKAKVLHTDGKTWVSASALVREDGTVECDYKFQKMSYGQTFDKEQAKKMVKFSKK